jgi:hypothetical protein
MSSESLQKHLLHSSQLDETELRDPGKEKTCSLFLLYRRQEFITLLSLSSSFVQFSLLQPKKFMYFGEKLRCS